MPKPNFYQSLHTTVIGGPGQPFEIQIRTREMDLIAERGHRGALEVQGGPPRRRTPTTRGSSGSASSRTGRARFPIPAQFLSSLKVDLYPDEVYTFTPKGEVFAFPRGATPIDFAYRVHTDVGHRCVGARVNGKLVPLRTPLQSGDIVEILTSPEPDSLARLALLGRHEPGAAQDPPLHPRGGEAAGRRARAEASRAGAQEVQADSQEAFLGREPRARAAALGILEARGPLRRDRLRKARAAERPRALRDRRRARPSRGREEGIGRLARRPEDPAVRRARHRGRRPQRPARHARQVLQPGARREDHRLHHAGPGSLGPFAELSQRPEPSLRPGAPDRRGLGGGEEARPTRSSSRCRPRTGPVCSPTSRRPSPARAPTSGASRRASRRRRRPSSRVSLETSDLKQLEKIVGRIRAIPACATSSASTTWRKRGRGLTREASDARSSRRASFGRARGPDYEKRGSRRRSSAS